MKRSRIIFGGITFIVLCVVALETLKPHAISDLSVLAFRQRELNQHPKDVNDLYLLATAYEDIGAHDRAKQILIGLLGQRPHFHSAEYELGIILYREGKHKEAHALWQQVEQSHDPVVQKMARTTIHDNP